MYSTTAKPCIPCPVVYSADLWADLLSSWLPQLLRKLNFFGITTFTSCLILQQHLIRFASIASLCVCTCVCVPNTKSICLHLCNLHASYAGQPFHLSFSPHQQACPKSLHPQPCNVPVQLPMLSQVDVTKVTYFWICQIRPCSGVTTIWFGDMRHMPLSFASGEHGSKAWVCWPELLPHTASDMKYSTKNQLQSWQKVCRAKTEHSAPFSFCMLW